MKSFTLLHLLLFTQLLRGGYLQDKSSQDAQEKPSSINYVTQDSLKTVSHHKFIKRALPYQVSVDFSGKIMLSEKKQVNDIFPIYRQDYSSTYPVMALGPLRDFDDGNLFATTAVLHSKQSDAVESPIAVVSASTLPNNNIYLGVLIILSIVLFTGIVYWGWLSRN